jgi:hypothetical protein
MIAIAAEVGDHEPGGDGYALMARLRHAFAFHYSPDGKAPKLIRYCIPGNLRELRMEYLAQSPTGNGCEAALTGVRDKPRMLADIRSGDQGRIAGRAGVSGCVDRNQQDVNGGNGRNAMARVVRAGS